MYGDSLRRTCFLLLWLGLAVRGSGQEALIERLSQQEQESGVDAEDSIQELLAEPIDLNQATPAELFRMPFLTPLQVESFLRTRKSEVYFSELSAALGALGVTGDTLLLAQQVFTVSVPQAVETRAPAVSRRWKGSARWRIGEPGTVEANWPGPPPRSYTRLRWQSGELSVGALIEKDPGEERLDDHRAYYLQWRRWAGGRGWQLVMGHYQIEWARGLTLWGPYGSSITSDVHAASRQWGRGLRPYASASENSAFSGIGFSRTWGHVELLSFGSSCKRDVVLGDGDEPVGFRNSGYHRTATELSQRDNLQATTFGAGIKFVSSNRQELGLLWYASRFDKKWRTKNVEANHFDFTGTRNSLVSVMGNWRFAGAHVGFEAAQSRSGGRGVTVVVSARRPKSSWTAALFRYDRRFHSPHGRSINAITDSPNSESGYSAGITLAPWPGLTTDFFYERSRRLWRTYQNEFPPNRERFGARLEWRFDRDLRLDLRYRSTVNDQMEGAGARAIQKVLVPNHRQSYRIELEHRLTPRVRLRPRVDIAYEQTQEIEPVIDPGIDGVAVESSPRSVRRSRTGTAVSFDIFWSLSNLFTVNLRQTFFDTPVPIYLYERDLPGVFTVRALRERGARRYIYLHIHAVRGIQLACKLACSTREISSFRQVRSCSWGLQLGYSR